MNTDFGVGIRAGTVVDNRNIHNIWNGNESLVATNLTRRVSMKLRSSQKIKRPARVQLYAGHTC